MNVSFCTNAHNKKGNFKMNLQVSNSQKHLLINLVINELQILEDRASFNFITDEEKKEINLDLNDLSSLLHDLRSNHV